MGNITSEYAIKEQADVFFKKIYTLNKQELQRLYETLQQEQKRYVQERASNIFTNESLRKSFYTALVEKQKIIDSRASSHQREKVDNITQFLLSCKSYFFKSTQQESRQQRQELPEMTEKLARKLFHLKVREKLDETYLKKQFRKLALKYHPDRPEGDTELFEHISDAYILLLEKATMQKQDKQFNEIKRESCAFRKKFESQGYQNKKLKKGPKGKFDVNRFNKLFQENRVATVEDDGYSDWMKDNTDNFIDESEVQKKLGGNTSGNRFNDVFSSLVPAKKQNEIVKYEGPQALYQGGEQASELGVDKILNFGGGNEKIKYTDLREAHSGERMIDPNDVSLYDHKNVEKLKQERTQIKDYSEEEWSRYQQALIQKEEAQKQRTEYLKQQDEQSARRYDSIHSRMLENVWRQ